MNKLQISLQNCYGINKLDAVLDFTECNVVVIYASNGMMKTSFLKTMADINNPKEEIYGRSASCELNDETGHRVSQDDIFVVKSLDEDFVPTHETDLLIDKELRQKYDDIYEEIAVQEQNLLNHIKSLSGITTRGVNTIEQQILEDFESDSTFINFMTSLKPDIESFRKLSLADLKYANIFNNDTKRIFEANNFRVALTEYINTYNSLLKRSKFFKKGFNHYNADVIVKTLENDGWFAAGHSVNVRRKIFPIKSTDQLNKLIKHEKERIIHDKELQQSFLSIDDILTTKGARAFREYLSEHKEILAELQDCVEFKRNLWKAYIAKYKDEYNIFLGVIEQSSGILQEITDNANNQLEKWKRVVDIFNSRFFVPFKIEISNKTDAVLGLQAPHRQIFFNDGTCEKEVGNDQLKRVLSQGERRAKYLMDIIFELESFKRNNKDKLLVFDDIADSFDYKNKYAIMEYLYDIAKYDMRFKLIVLTHNFDFYRSLTSRLGVARPNRLMANKTQDGIVLEVEKFQKKHPFEIWKKCQDVKDAIALIPFVRNIVEFCKNENDEDYVKLTGLLHKKDYTSSMDMDDLQNIFNKYIQISADGGGIFFGNKKVETRIYELADNILNNASNDLRDKIILSIAARLRLETYMIKRINDADFVSNIQGNQTHKLSEKYRELYPDDTMANAIITEINLITPENIHINSFMYEPIIDISIDKLTQVYSKVLDLIKV